MRPNYDKAVRKTIDVLIDFEFNTIPIDLDIIFKKYRRTIKKCTYTKFSSMKGLSIQEICDYFESDLGACAYDRTSERYIVYYNDTKNNKGLDRFTIAHELAHIFLNHHAKTDSDVLLRKRMPEQKYRSLEHEANCFARNLLAPIPLVERVVDLESGFVIRELQEAFNITFHASQTRNKFIILDRYRITSADYNYFNTYDITFGYNCDRCNNTDIDSHSYCKICGVEHTPFEKTHGIFYTDGIKTDKNRRVIQCPACENEVFTKGLYFCKICGTPQYNYCTYTDCQQVNDGNARYCRYCGSMTVYFSMGLLREIQQEVLLR